MYTKFVTNLGVRPTTIMTTHTTRKQLLLLKGTRNQRFLLHIPSNHWLKFDHFFKGALQFTMGNGGWAGMWSLILSQDDDTCTYAYSWTTSFIVHPPAIEEICSPLKSRTPNKAWREEMSPFFYTPARAASINKSPHSPSATHNS